MAADVPRITVALITPLEADGSIDEAGLQRQAVWVGQQGISSVIPGGTTGEFAAMTVAERLSVLELTRAAMPDAFIFANVSACALADALELTRQALASTAKPNALLVLPPFYHRPFNDAQSEAGVERYFRAYLTALAEIEQQSSSPAAFPGVFFYTFAVHTQQPISPALYGRLASAFPLLVRGIKASGVGLDEASMLATAAPGTVVAVGNGRIQLDCLRRGLHVVSGDGLPICWALHQLETWHASGATAACDSAQRVLIETWRGEMDKHDEIPANKAALAHQPEVATREVVRPPLVTVAADSQEAADIQRAIASVKSQFDSLR